MPAAAARRALLITPAQSGKTFRLAKGGTATLRLSSRWAWTEPRVSSRAIDLTPVAFFVDPGYSEWVVKARDARERRRSAPTAARRAPTAACAAKSLRVTIVVP